MKSKANLTDTPTWTEKNDECKLVPQGESGIAIPDSSNGRDETGELVLRFSASISFDPAFFNFNNKHMLAIAPAGRRNVTDSYVQLQAMFGERAADCNANDASCNNNQNSQPNSQNNTNNSGNSNSSNGASSNTNGGNQNG